jgi:hypothetical protein
MTPSAQPAATAVRFEAPLPRARKKARSPLVRPAPPGTSATKPSDRPLPAAPGELSPVETW